MSTVTDLKYPQPEIWGGLECTINRVADNFHDQLVDAGHYTRPGDIEMIAGLGIRKLRYPVLWEFHEKEKGQAIDWNWTSQQLYNIRNTGMEPIAGLLHHGSGPSFTNLQDPLFPGLFAAYAAQVAQQFPWIKYYTPVNEPLTTARFSGLYGIWYPHGKGDANFVAILINELKATILAMQEIRKINPAAILVQTEDLARIHSTEALHYQAHFENHRRWLSWDLLCGKVDRQHAMWNYCIDSGITEEQLGFFINNPCPPGIIGCNYYVTSERWLDENITDYPACTHGSNGLHIYADTEAVRYGKQLGLGTLLKETWERYQIPIAITECHIACTREEQLRWLHETWATCKEITDSGINITAVTAWSLFGSYDWNSLLTRADRYYEPGIFDIADPHKPRPTALAKLVHSIAINKESDHPLLYQKGWWNKERTQSLSNKKARPILLIGKNGTLATAFRRICVQRSIPVIALGRDEIDITNPASVEKIISQYKPWAVINTAGYVRVDDAEDNQHECYLLNTKAPELLGALCEKHGIRFMTFSSDLVFDGDKQTPYYENDLVRSLNVYGESKVMGEELVLNENKDALVIRSSSFFGPWDRFNFVYYVTDIIRSGRSLTAADNVMISPTYVPDLVHRSLDLFIDEEKGIWHVCNDGHLTWFDLASMVADRIKNDRKNIIPTPAEKMDWKAKRPLYSVLQSEKGGKLPPLENALERYFQEQIA